MQPPYEKRAPEVVAMSRVCADCGQACSRASFSGAQWKKGDGASRCGRCAAARFEQNGGASSRTAARSSEQNGGAPPAAAPAWRALADTVVEREAPGGAHPTSVKAGSWFCFVSDAVPEDADYLGYMLEQVRRIVPAGLRAEGWYSLCNTVACQSDEDTVTGTRTAAAEGEELASSLLARKLQPMQIRRALFLAAIEYSERKAGNYYAAKMPTLDRAREPLPARVHEAACRGDVPDVLAYLYGGGHVERTTAPAAREISRAAATETLLMAASRNGRDALVSALLRHGADRDAQARSLRSGMRTNSALMMAVEAGHVSTVEMLLEASANPKLRFEAGLKRDTLYIARLHELPSFGSKSSSGVPARDRTKIVDLLKEAIAEWDDGFGEGVYDSADYSPDEDGEQDGAPHSEPQPTTLPSQPLSPGETMEARYERFVDDDTVAPGYAYLGVGSS